MGRLFDFYNGDDSRLFCAIGYMLYNGVGMSGIRSPVGWGMMIITFVFWIGIGHAGTLISAILFLVLQKAANGD